MRRKERKRYRIAILVSMVVAFFLGRCSVTGCSDGDEKVEQSDSTTIVADNQAIEADSEVEKELVAEEDTTQSIEYDTVAMESEEAIAILKRTHDAKWDNFLEVNDDEVAQPLKTNFRGRRSEVFNDSNYVHLEAAEAVGIVPITDMASAWNLSKPVKLIASCQEYYLDELTHSYPFLVPEAEKLLKDIGARFNQLLWERGKSKYRIKVTSMLRTPETIKDLMRRNKNAVEVSAHQYATTFDISYSKFIKDSKDNPRTFANLSELLSEVIQEFHTQGRCYVKYEAKQSCFHITVRPTIK